MPTASPDASDAGGPTTSWTSVLLSTSVMREKVVALNSSGEKTTCTARHMFRCVCVCVCDVFFYPS